MLEIFFFLPPADADAGAGAAAVNVRQRSIEFDPLAIISAGIISNTILPRPPAPLAMPAALDRRRQIPFSDRDSRSDRREEFAASLRACLSLTRSSPVAAGRANRQCR